MQRQRKRSERTAHRSTNSSAAVQVDARSQVCRSTNQPTGNDTFFCRLQQLWGRVLKLEDTGIIHDEFGKFTFAYRLAEAELQQLCSENDSLRQALHELKGDSFRLSYDRNY